MTLEICKCYVTNVAESTRYIETEIISFFPNCGTDIPRGTNAPSMESDDSTSSAYVPKVRSILLYFDIQRMY